MIIPRSRSQSSLYLKWPLYVSVLVDANDVSRITSLLVQELASEQKQKQRTLLQPLASVVEQQTTRVRAKNYTTCANNICFIHLTEEKRENHGVWKKNRGCPDWG
uniref:(northern house mosquito) hypothetical protein n=1 Tax=Culex pipiens TaxID=7175 RepID=A0A8D8G2Z9_CULPI